MDTTKLLIAILMVLFLFYFVKSNFTQIDKTYECSDTSENRRFPSGHVPGSYLGLSKEESDELLRKFVDNI